MKTCAKDYFVYTVVFCLGYLVACGGGGNTTGGSNPTTLASQMLNSALRHTAIFPTNAGNQPVLAALLGAQVSPQPKATITNPSQVAQSYESICGAYEIGTTVLTAIHAAFGKSGFVSMNYADPGLTVCSPALSSIGGDEGGNPRGYPIVFAGTINTLVVYGTFVSGTPFRCVDTTNLSALPDNTFVRAYYDLAHDAVVLGNGTTQLATTCSITVPQGDDVEWIYVEWLKS